MLRVFAEYKRLNPDSMLWIVGEGDMKDDMLALANELGISNSIYWWGRRNDVNRLMCGMDLLLQPSIFEGLGIVLIEAQATGLPCVSSASVIPKEAEATQLLFLHDLSANLNSWAQLCYDVLQQASLNKSRNHIKIDSSYTIDKEALRLENILFKHQN